MLLRRRQLLQSIAHAERPRCCGSVCPQTVTCYLIDAVRTHEKRERTGRRGHLRVLACIVAKRTRGYSTVAARLRADSTDCWCIGVGVLCSLFF